MIAEDDIVAAYSAAAVAELDILAELLFLEDGSRFLGLGFRKQKRKNDRMDTTSRRKTIKGQKGQSTGFYTGTSRARWKSVAKLQ